MSQLKLYLLGPARLEQNGKVVEVETRKATALLAYLALHAERLSRDQLAAFFWPDYDQERAYANLRRTLWALNKALGEGWLMADNLTLELRQQAGVWIDVLEFHRLLAQCRTHGHRGDEVCVACLAPLGEAVTLVRGDFLAGFSLRDSAAFDDWHFFEAESLRKQLATSLEKLVRGHSGQQEDETAIDYARRWLALDPLHEPTHCWLMQLYALTGQPAAVARQYQECVRVLKAELGAPPEQETTALYEQIRTGKLRKRADKVSEDGAERPLHDHPDFGELSRAITLTPPVEFPAETVGRAAFVARARELAELDQCLKRALAGQGGVVFVTGEAGSGKTALLRAFAERASVQSNDLLVASGYCNVQSGLGDPYLPFRQILRLLTGDLGAQWAHGVLQRGHAERLWVAMPLSVAALVAAGPDLIDLFVPGAALLNRTGAAGGLPSEELQRLEQAVQRQTRDAASPDLGQPNLLEQYANVLRTLARQQPLLLVVDDLHWADAASLDLLFHLSRQLAESRILLVGAYRPEDVALGRAGARHPLEPVVNELQRASGERAIDLDQARGREFVDAWLDTQPNRLGVPFRSALHGHTHGQPLFTVELVRAMQARSELVRDDEGHWVEAGTLDWRTLPARVEAVIAERIARLEEPVRQLLAAASVEGEEFTAEVLARVQALPERSLLQTLSRDLEKRHHLVRRRAEVPAGARLLTRYQFSHALFQHYLYNELSAGERRLLHGEVAAALVELHQGRTDEITAQLAHHYAEAGETAKAIEYLLQAGDRARTLYAHQEAIAAYQRALVFLKEQGDYERAARTLMKLGLTYHLTYEFQPAQQAFDEGFALWQRTKGSWPAAPLLVAPHALRLPGGDPATLDPAYTDDGHGAAAVEHLFSGLVECGAELDIVPAVARAWEVLEEGRKYIFHLRDDVAWSDGMPVTAADFEYTWRRILHPATGSTNATLPYDVLLLDIKGARAFYEGRLSDPEQVGVHARDALTLEVELEEPTPYFLYLVSQWWSYAVPRHVVAAHGAAWADVQHIVTNGPFRLESWQPGHSMVFVRNPTYHGRFVGNVQRVERSFVADWASRLTLYEADELDVIGMGDQTPSEIDRVRQHHASDYVAIPWLLTGSVGFDVSQPPFDDARVRRAFALATNREMLANVALRGYVAPATGGVLPPGMPGYSTGIGLPYDPARARQLLAEAGYPGGRGFPAVDALLTADVAGELTVRSLAMQWRASLGVEIRWNSNTTAYREFMDRGQAPPLFFQRNLADYPDPDTYLRYYQYLFGRQLDLYARLVAQTRRTSDLGERLKLCQQADRLLVEEAIMIPLWYERLHRLVKPWVRKFSISALGVTFWQDVIIEPH